MSKKNHGQLLQDFFLKNAFKVNASNNCYATDNNQSKIIIAEKYERLYYKYCTLL